VEGKVDKATKKKAKGTTRKLCEYFMTKQELIEGGVIKISDGATLKIEVPILRPIISHLDYVLGDMTMKTHLTIDFTSSNKRVNNKLSYHYSKDN